MNILDCKRATVKKIHTSHKYIIYKSKISATVHKKKKYSCVKNEIRKFLEARYINPSNNIKKIQEY